MSSPCKNGWGETPLASDARTPLAFLRHVALAEAVSYLLLLGVAMPLKYLAGQPLPVRIVGMIHGILFVALALALIQAKLKGLSVKRCLTVFALSFVPIVPFFFDRRIRRWETSGAGK
ncbi:MAG: DUF3817 domain-containing protein [Opitutaceae bacterium]|nr:DUF3817 domain-containing protein [Opitutaceae bacterium]